MGSAPLLYVHGNHDVSYRHRPPEECDCIEDSLYIYKRLQILGLRAVPDMMAAGDSSIKKNGSDIVCELDYRGTKNINAYELNI